MVLSSEIIAVDATWNVAASSAYCVCGAEYYLGSREPEGVWYALRAAMVLPKEFARLYEGHGENGHSLITNAGGKADRRVPAFDLPFSAPRSVSLAWAFADEELLRNLEAAGRSASQATIGRSGDAAAHKPARRAGGRSRRFAI
jgi:hypothetical protein